MEPLFLTLDEALEIHEQQIELYGGSNGIRDVAGLESAVATPQATFGGEFLHTSIPAMAAAYLFHLCRNHPFIDGNKRVALVAAVVFLDLNGVQVSAPPEETAELVLRTAEGKVEKAALAGFLRKHAR